MVTTNLTSGSSSVQSDAGQKLGLRVLVAEDSPINQAFLKVQLDALGCSVIFASDGLQALQLWAPGVFDVVLTDVNMPLMNGYQLARALRERDTEILIMGVTGNAMREEGERCLAAGMNSWIVKPLGLMTLRALLLNVKPTQACLQVPTEIEHLSSTQYVPDSIVLSAGMRELFLRTIGQDVDVIRDALAANHQHIVREKLHGLCGSLAVVRADELSHIYGQLEQLLTEQSLNPPLVADIERALGWLSDLLLSVSHSTCSE